MAEELDILQDTTQDGAVFADTTTQADSEEVVDNARYNDEGERLYYWVPPSELGDPSRTSQEEELYKDVGGYYTEAEIRAAWDAKQGMGYLKEQVDWDNYWGYISERQDLIDDGTLQDGLSIRQAGRQAVQEAIKAAGGLQAVGGAKAASAMFRDLNAQAQTAAWKEFLSNSTQMAMMEKYGIPTTFQNNDGDVFQWNGSSYTKTYKVDDSFDVGGLLKTVVAAALTAGAAGFLAPTLAGALGVSNTVAKGLITAALDLAQGNDIGLGTALSLVGADVLPGGATLGEMVDNGSISQDVIDAVVGEITNPENYETDNDGVTIVWEGHGGTDELGNPIINLPNFEPTPTKDPDGGGGAAEDPSADADNDGVPASQDPDDNNPDVSVQSGGGIVNETGEEVTTGGEKVEGNGTPVGSEYRWKYIGNGCFVQIDENGQEIPDTKVCDPDYTEEDYELYEVGGIFGRGTDAPFGTPDGDEETDVTPAAGTQTEDCLSNGDKIIYTADGEGNWETEVIAGGCLEKEEGEDDGGITLGGSPVWDGGADDGDDDTAGGTDAGGDAEAGGTDAGDDDTAGDVDSGDADTDADGDGTEGTGETGAGDDGAGDDGTGEGEGGDGEGEGDGGDGEVSLGGGMMGKPASFQGMMAGLSYEPQPIPGIIPTPQIDYAADLEELIARQLSKRGMFT